MERMEDQINGEEIDELDHISRIALLIDDLSNEDPTAKMHSIQRLTQIASLLGKISYKCSLNSFY